MISVTTDIWYDREQFFVSQARIDQYSIDIFIPLLLREDAFKSWEVFSNRSSSLDFRKR